MLERVINKVNYIYHGKIKSNNILCIGDSHTEVFNYIHTHKLFSGYYFNTSIVHGATASGIDNPNSKTKAKKVFDYYLNENILDHHLNNRKLANLVLKELRGYFHKNPF